MHIISISSNNYYRNIFINTLSVKYNNYSFGKKAQNQDGRSSQLYNAMSGIKEDSEKITIKELSEQTGIPLSSIYMCLNKSPKLQELFAEINSDENMKQRSSRKKRHSNTYVRKDPGVKLKHQKDIEIKEQKEEIRAVILEAQKQQKKLYTSDISRITGINPTNVQSRIACDKELHDLFTQVMMHKSTQYSEDEKKQQIDQIWKILLDAYNSDSFISDKDIASIVGINETTVKRRINSDEQLKILWDSICKLKRNMKSQKRIQDETEVIQSVLNLAKDSHKKITIEQISLMTNISVRNVRKRVLENQKLMNLLYSLKQYPPLFSSTEEQNEDNSADLPSEISGIEIDFQKSDLILKMLIEAKKNKKPISINAIINETGATLEEIFTVINNYRIKEKKESQPESATKIKKPNGPDNKNNDESLKQITQKMNHRKIKQKVLKMILDAKRAGRKISYNSITNDTGASREEIDKIISDYKKQIVEHKKQLQIENEKTLEAIRKREEQENQLFLNIIRSKSVESREQTSVINAKNTTEFPLNFSEDQYQVIEIMLKRAQNKGFKISLSAIANNLHINEKTTYRAIKSRTDLLKIWQEVKAPEQFPKHNDDD